MTGNDTNTKGTTMTATANAIYQPGQHVWTIFTDCVSENIVAEISGDYIRLKSRKNNWHKPEAIFVTKRDASIALAAKFRDRAASLIKAAEELESV